MRKYKKTSKQEVISDIKRVAKKLGVRTITKRQYDKYGNFSERLARSLFKRWNKALKAAGLEIGFTKDITKKELISDLKRVSKKLRKKTFSGDEYDKHGKFSSTAFISRFKFWNKAMIKAGLTVESRKDISDREILIDLRRIARKIKKNAFSFLEYKQQRGIFSRSVFEDHFKGWNKSLIKADLEVERFRYVSDSQLLEDLRRVAELLCKNTIGCEEYTQHGKFSIAVFMNHFDSWHEALIKAGLFPRISSEDDFLDACKTHEAVKAIVEAFNGNEADIINVLAIVSSGKWSKKKMTKWLFKPKMTKWIGEFRKPSLQPRVILEVSFTLLPYDKNNVIRKLLLDRLITWADAERGANPTKARKAKVIKLLEGYVDELLKAA